VSERLKHASVTKLSPKKWHNTNETEQFRKKEIVVVVLLAKGFG